MLRSPSALRRSRSRHVVPVLRESNKKGIMKALSKCVFVCDGACHHCAAVEANLLHHPRYFFSDYTRNARGSRFGFFNFSFFLK